MIYGFEKTDSIFRVFVGDIEVAAIAGGDAFRIFCAGVATSGCSLLNRKTGQFVIGTLDQLLHDELK